MQLQQALHRGFGGLLDCMCHVAAGGSGVVPWSTFIPFAVVVEIFFFSVPQSVGTDGNRQKLRLSFLSSPFVGVEYRR